MTGGQCVGDVCHNPTLLSYQKSLWSEVAFAVQRWWAVTPIRPGMLGMRSLVELQWNPKTERPQSVEWNPETIQATPGLPGPDLSPVFGPRNSSFSITRSLLSWKTAPFTKPQKHLYAWGNVQSLIIVALRSWLVFHVGSV